MRVAYFEVDEELSGLLEEDLPTVFEVLVSFVVLLSELLLGALLDGAESEPEVYLDVRVVVIGVDVVVLTVGTPEATVDPSLPWVVRYVVVVAVGFVVMVVVLVVALVI